MKQSGLWFLSLLLTLGFGCRSAMAEAGACAGFAKLALPQTKILREEIVAAGQFTPPYGGNLGIYSKLPAFCRVVVQSTPTPDSDIKTEIWMPVHGWNGKFRGQGNGGFAGEIYYSSIALAVLEGYASAGTDTGHPGTDAAWALGHPEKVNDFGYRGVHLMTATAKAVVDAYYGKAPTRSYFAACSDGGREALMEAQRFPDDYDGILAGAPAYVWTNLVTSGVHKMQALLLDPASYIPPAKIETIATAVNAACDAADGVKDGILNDPRQCHFQPETLLCKGADADTCLTQPQVTALQALYAPTRDDAGRQVYPATPPGGEAGQGGWIQWVVGTAPGKSLGYFFGTGYFSDMVYENPRWDYKTFTVSAGLKAALARTAMALNATDTNLQPFARHGGKLILYHGWNDPAISALSTVQYYEQVQKANTAAASFVRLFMVPGMQHCTGGPGPTDFGQFAPPRLEPDDAAHDINAALEAWVEKGTAPEQVIAEKLSEDNSAPTIKMTRPLCAYPETAKYKGSGDTSKAENFVCTAP